MGQSLSMHAGCRTLVEGTARAVAARKAAHGAGVAVRPLPRSISEGEHAPLPPREGSSTARLTRLPGNESQRKKQDWGSVTFWCESERIRIQLGYGSNGSEFFLQ